MIGYCEQSNETSGYKRAKMSWPAGRIVGSREVLCLVQLVYLTKFQANNLSHYSLQSVADCYEHSSETPGYE